MGCRVYQDRKHVRYILVQDITKQSLKYVINRYVEPGSVIFTDEFSSYKVVEIEGYIHPLVNHSKLYLDPLEKLAQEGTHAKIDSCYIVIYMKLHGVG